MMTYSAALVNGYKSDHLRRIVEKVDQDFVYEEVYIADERFYRNPYAQLALVAEYTEEVRVATGVTNPYTRNPAYTAAAIATIDEASNGRALLGFGAGSPMALSPIGIEQKRPIGTVRDAVSTIRDLHKGDAVTFERPEFELRDLDLDFEVQREVPIYVAGRGPQILELAGRVGDGAIAGAGLTSEAGMEYAFDQVADGARAAGRKPSDVPVICWAFLSMANEQSTAIEAVVDLIIRIVDAVPTETLTTIGVNREEAETIKALPDVDDMTIPQMREAVSRPLVEQFAIAGTPAQCRDHVKRLRTRGVNRLAVLPFENDERGILDTLKAFSEHVAKEVSAR